MFDNLLIMLFIKIFIKKHEKCLYIVGNYVILRSETSS